MVRILFKSVVYPIWCYFYPPNPNCIALDTVCARNRGLHYTNLKESTPIWMIQQTKVFVTKNWTMCNPMLWSIYCQKFHEKNGPAFCNYFTWNWQMSWEIFGESSQKFLQSVKLRWVSVIFLVPFIRISSNFFAIFDSFDRRLMSSVLVE